MSSSRTKNDGPHPVDVHVGYRVRIRRAELGISQAALAEKIDLTFQQVQKYESGTNRISASKLYEISAVLNTPIGYFFSNLSNGDGGGDQAIALPEKADYLASSIKDQRLLRSIMGLPGPLKRKVSALVLAIDAGAEGQDDEDHTEEG